MRGVGGISGSRVVSPPPRPSRASLFKGYPGLCLKVTLPTLAVIFPSLTYVGHPGCLNPSIKKEYSLKNIEKQYQVTLIEPFLCPRHNSQILLNPGRDH